MEPATGGSEPEHLENREWILRCEGFVVHGPSGELIGTVRDVVYEHSARWDRPRALTVLRDAGPVRIPIEAVARADARARRVDLHREV